LFGWRTYRRKRQAARVADAALVAFFTRLGAEIRAERWARMWEQRAAIWDARGEITVLVMPPNPYLPTSWSEPAR
jgi:hypothetical protein